MRELRDTGVVFERYLRRALTNPVLIAVSLVQPVLYILLFAPLLNSVAGVRGFPSGGAYNVFVPGLLVQLTVFGVSSASWGLVADLKRGVLERMRVTPVSRVALLLGRALSAVATLTLQAVVILVFSIPFGLRIRFLDAVVLLALIALIGIMTICVSYTLALAVRSEEAAGAVSFAAALPLLLLSGVLLPLSLAPAWLRDVAALNPLSYGVEAARAIAAAHLSDPAVPLGFALMGMLAALAVTTAVRSFSRSLV